MTLRRTLINSHDIKEILLTERSRKSRVKEKPYRQACWGQATRAFLPASLISLSTLDLPAQGSDCCQYACKAYRGSIASSLVIHEVLVPGLLADSPIPYIK